MAKVNIAVGMIGSTARAALWLALGALTLGAAVATRHAFAQEPAPAPAVLSAGALAELVGPIALYPDDLVGIVLPASTYPLQVVQAARFLDTRAKNPGVQPDADWDDSVVALLNYPEVVKLMNDDLDWTWRLGDAVISQRPAVLDAIQGFRDRARAAGNLRSDDRQVVEDDADGAIAIKPADPEVIYVPYYEPERVVVYQTVPVYHYYPYAYPVYYYPYPSDYAFETGFFWGVTSAFVIGWHSHFLHVQHHDYWGHPYYGRHYYDPFYFRRDVNVSVSHGNYVWEPHYRHGGQPFTRSDGRRFTGTHDARDSAFQGSYRNGQGDGASRRAGGQQQREVQIDPRAATRDRALPGVSPPRANGNGGTYRSNSSGSNSSGSNRSDSNRAGSTGAGAPLNGGATTVDGQRAGDANGLAPRGGPTRGQPERTRDATPHYRLAPPATVAPQVRDAAPTGADVPAARAPGRYREGGQYRTDGLAQALRQAQPDAAPTLRAAPPQAERNAGEPRIYGGGSGVYRGAAQPPQRAQRDADGGSARTDSSRGDGGSGRSEPAYRGGGDEGHSSGGRSSYSSGRGRSGR